MTILLCAEHGYIVSVVQPVATNALSPIIAESLRAELRHLSADLRAGMMWLRKPKCAGILLSAAIVVGATGGSGNFALASPHHAKRVRHDSAVVAKPKGPRSIAVRHHERAHARSSSLHVAKRHAKAAHTDMVPLTNTTWDNPSVAPAVSKAIENAAAASNIDPNLLSTIAWRESRFDPVARNHQSSARGLLQFTTETWLQAVREFGAANGIAGYAAAIQRSRSGALVVADPRVRAAILRLRSDPVLSTKLAAETMKRQRETMERGLGRPVTRADLYLLHVLGPSGTARFLKALAEHPNASSVEVASARVVRNAGLLARDDRPLTVANTYAAIEAMLAAQRTHSEPLLAAAPAEPALATPAEVSKAP
jgi:hypothetical protein